MINKITLEHYNYGRMTNSYVFIADYADEEHLDKMLASEGAGTDGEICRSEEFSCRAFVDEVTKNDENLPKSKINSDGEQKTIKESKNKYFANCPFSDDCVRGEKNCDMEFGGCSECEVCGGTINC